MARVVDFSTEIAQVKEEIPYGFSNKERLAFIIGDAGVVLEQAKLKTKVDKRNQTLRHTTSFFLTTINKRAVLRFDVEKPLDSIVDFKCDG